MCTRQHISTCLPCRSSLETLSLSPPSLYIKIHENYYFLLMQLFDRMVFSIYQNVNDQYHHYYYLHLILILVHTVVVIDMMLLHPNQHFQKHFVCEKKKENRKEKKKIGKKKRKKERKKERKKRNREIESSMKKVNNMSD